MKTNRIVILFIVAVVCFIVIRLKNSNPFIGQYHSAEIMNGNTGEVYQIEPGRMEGFITALSELDARFSGLQLLWTSGYEFRIILHRNNDVKDVFIYGEHDLQSGHIKYRTERNILQTIDAYLD